MPKKAKKPEKSAAVKAVEAEKPKVIKKPFFFNTKTISKTVEVTTSEGFCGYIEMANGRARFLNDSKDKEFIFGGKITMKKLEKWHMVSKGLEAMIAVACGFLEESADEKTSK